MESVICIILCVFCCESSLMDPTVLEISSMASFCSFMALVICSERFLTFSAFSLTVYWSGGKEQWETWRLAQGLGVAGRRGPAGPGVGRPGGLRPVHSASTRMRG